MTALRFTPEAAASLRAAIRDAGGVEVFAVGDVDPRNHVERVEVHARGQEGAVVALRSRARAGQVVIHNHPSGNLRPSDPDMQLAGTFGEDGVGFVIVDSAVTRDNWVVEPKRARRVAVDEEALRAFFEEDLPRAMPGWEPRPGQLAMAREVARSLDIGGTVVLEAGTGTGKSLAYLAPAALWALANDAKVVVATYTRTLQGQLVRDDLPMVTRVLPQVRTAVLKGRANYVCRRKLELAAASPDASEALRRMVPWAEVSATGDAAEIDFAVEEDDWERVESDVDQTLRARCPHFNRCFWYEARRKAAAAHLVVVNHALLLADLSLKAQDAQGILPSFDRVVLDEAHHLEQAVTGVSAVRLGSRGLVRAINPLLGRGRRPGALDRIADAWPTVAPKAHEAVDALARVRDEARMGFEVLGQQFPVPTRIHGVPPLPALFEELAEELERGAARLGALVAALDGEEIPPRLAQPLLDVQRAMRRMNEGATAAKAFLVEEPGSVRFLDPVAGRGHARGSVSAVAVSAPIDVGPIVQRLLVERLHTRAFTSATLAVNGNVTHWLGRVGLEEDAPFAVFPSPFAYAEQAVLALPRDLPPPDAEGWLDTVGDCIVEAIRASGGGAFVLCTSHDAVRALADYAEAALGSAHAILRQGRGSRDLLLARFRDDPHAVLFGTDSFWEGVSVRGDGLRLVVIPRLPFRVPTEPVAEARHERVREEGRDPFRTFSLPEAVLKLRQGFGRLVRSRTDRGAVLILDRRIHEAWYGRVFLASLPDAARVVGPRRVVMERLRAFYRGFPRAGSGSAE
jgi:ATP-dependent DNA helicase DinG